MQKQRLLEAHAVAALASRMPVVVAWKVRSRQADVAELACLSLRAHVVHPAEAS